MVAVVCEQERDRAAKEGASGVARAWERVRRVAANAATLQEMKAAGVFERRRYPSPLSQSKKEAP